MIWSDRTFLAVANSAPGKGVAPGGGLWEAQDDVWGLAHTCQWDFIFCFYPNVLLPQGVYDKDKHENRMEKERFKTLY